LLEALEEIFILNLLVFGQALKKFIYRVLEALKLPILAVNMSKPNYFCLGIDHKDGKFTTTGQSLNFAKNLRC
jgi:hypothetical protein